MLLLVRLVGMAVGGVALWQFGVTLAGLNGSAGAPEGSDALRYVLVLALAGSALGLLVTPYATVVPLRRLWQAARGMSAPNLLGGTVGLLVGLLIAALAAFPTSMLPDPLGRWLPFGVAVLFGWLGAAIGALRKHEIFRVVRAAVAGGGAANGLRGTILLDTSAVVDGRILEIRLSGFVTGDLVLPRFVLEELQLIADSADPLRRQRGRRGLDMLDRLQREVSLEVADTDYPDLRGVDSKLVRLARHRAAAIVTTDYNLSRVASLQGVPVLNINDLAHALRSVVVASDTLSLDIVQEGRERGQGIGYLDDGTMVVVENGRPLLGQKADVEVTRVLPTAGGRIVFSRVRPPGEDNPSSPGADRSRLRVIRTAAETEGH